MELYRGASRIDGSLIVAISTESANVKTGDMIQLWILDARMNPYEAIKQNADRSVCGDCKHRGKSCYVHVGYGPLGVYNGWIGGKYKIANNFDHFVGKKVRLGAYGDPVALPLKIIKGIAENCAGYTGYTHQWKQAYAQPYKAYLMASVDTLGEYYQAKAMGWRCFRVKNEEDSKLSEEIVCPASIEAGKKSTCQKCLLCSGLDGKGSKDIVINVHGLEWKKERFRRTIALQMVG